MSRPQSGIIPSPFFHNRIQVLDLYDLPMSSMTVGQFSVMIPGLAHQLVRAHSSEGLRVTVGFGFMFWTLSWHGQTPKQFNSFEELESGDRKIDEGEGDLWVHYSSTDPALINKLIGKVENNLEKLVQISKDESLLWDNPPETEQEISEDIWIPEGEPEFAKGTFLLQLEVEHSPQYLKSMLASLRSLLTQGEELSDQVLFREMKLVGGKKGTLLLFFHKKPRLLDELFENWIDEEQDHLAWGENGIISAQATRFFIPSLDVLTGLRQGGIRMNRFSQTRQWKD